jgi:short-subunit dehydrogenase
MSAQRVVITGASSGIGAALPRPLYDRLFARAPRKPRRSG